MSEPTPPDKPKKELKPGLGEVMAVAGGLRVAHPPSTVNLAAPGPSPDLDKHLASWRSLFNFGLSCTACAMTALAMIPLFSVLGMLAWRGGQRLGLALFTELPPAARMVGGGIGNALLGTLLMVAIASL